MTKHDARLMTAGSMSVSAMVNTCNNKRVKMSIMKYLISILLVLLTKSETHAQDPIELSTQPSSPPILSDASFLSPSTSPTTQSPTDWLCLNTENWYTEIYGYSEFSCTGGFIKLGCDDERVGCWDYGYYGVNLDYGMADYHCCKCRPECFGQCNEPTGSISDNWYYDAYCGNYYGGSDDSTMDEQENENVVTYTGVAVFVVCCMMCCLGRCNYEEQQNARREATRSTMSARRRQQRETNSQGLTEEERNHARYELFVTKFHFQTVLPDKSNTSASSLRDFANKQDEEHPDAHDDDASAIVKSEKPSRSSLSKRLSSWRRPSSNDECCVCLEPYMVGETICAPITTECNHVFHEGCILQWVKNNDKCPLCRVELLKD